MLMETVPEKPKVEKVSAPELRFEDIGATDKEGNALAQANAHIANAVRKLVRHVNTCKNIPKCKSVVTIKVVIDHRPNANGTSEYSASSQIEVKTPAPLPKLDVLKPIELTTGTPTLARGHPEDDTSELPFGE